MPIYEFYCPENNTIFSFLAKSMAYQNKTPRCPVDPSYSMKKRISGFAFIGKAKDPEDMDPAMDNMDEGKMERVMAELERDMAGFDEENPDPRQMAHLMRKMSDLTGEKLPGEFEDMVKRLEAGEDPEKLEEEYGDLMEGDDFDVGGEGAEARLRLLRRKILGSKRDPDLYDMAEYCD